MDMVGQGRLSCSKKTESCSEQGCRSCELDLNQTEVVYVHDSEGNDLIRRREKAQGFPLNCAAVQVYSNSSKVQVFQKL